MCDNGVHYLVKFRNNPHGDGRAIVAEEVVALAGSLIGAPVPRVDLVDVLAELVATIKVPFARLS